MTENTKPKNHLFAPGKSGNPAGKAKGTKNKTTLIKQAIEAEMVDEVKGDAIKVFRKAVNMALKGNEAMIKLVVERFLPPAKNGIENLRGGSGGIQIFVGEMPPQQKTIDAEDAEIIGEQTDVNTESDS